MLLVPMIIIGVLVRTTTSGPALYWSERMGQHNRPFNMPKFRTMYLNTPLVATDKLNDPNRHITRLGHVLRKTSLDELPQLLLFSLAR